MKELGFKRSTLAGLSFAITDLRIPSKKPDIIEAAQKRADRVEKNMNVGAITERERYNALLDIWAHAREEVTKEMMDELKYDTRDERGALLMPKDPKGKPYLNPVALMADSKARGSVDNFRQLSGMRGLMSRPSGEIMETPIKTNFREGLSVLEYFTSTHGARKGLADTALKTADSGYLTRKLADVAQNVIIAKIDCGTQNGVRKTAIFKGEQVDVALREVITGRCSADTIINPITDEVIVKEGQIITETIAGKLETELNLDTVRVRSPLTCESPVGVCAKCYGVDLSTNKLVEEGLAVGIIAAQSIGEPGTQLTMRTFHTGGSATRELEQNQLRAGAAGIVDLARVNAAEVADTEGNKTIIVLNRGTSGEITINDAKGRELERQKVPYGALLVVKHGDTVKGGQQLCHWDPHRTPILAEKSGRVRFDDIVEGETARLEAEGKSDIKRYVMTEHRGERHPRIVIEDPTDGKILDFHYLPAKARVDVLDGQLVVPGVLLARQPKESKGTSDITSGLPRVTEIFEARKPKDPSVLAEISGTIEIQPDKRRGKTAIVVRGEGGIEKEHHVPNDRQLRVHGGDGVEAGDPLIEGPLVPHDILRIKGEDSLQSYLLAEVQNVYRTQNQKISDKHIEIIISMMLRKVKVDNPGDTKFLPGEVVDKFRFRAGNEAMAKMGRIDEPGDTDLAVGTMVSREELKEIVAQAEAKGGKPPKAKKPRFATAKTLLLGITKASLQSESFVSAASFQETTKVLTEAAIAGKDDTLVGLKENVILGHLIPAGTAFKPYFEMKLEHNGTPVQEVEPEIVTPPPAPVAAAPAAPATEPQAAAPGASPNLD
jgi:DNA-directed RNA polymerase subunit beta'